jgi:DHA1 family bicyclomycin/chloramphenicol resistance-like MFS transporter
MMRLRPEGLGFTVLLGTLSALPPLSIDMGLPAFPALERELGASAAGAGLTLSLFLVGFAVAQLVLGPLSDRVGRRPVLLGGLTLYATAGMLCAAAPSIVVLLVLRLIQGACAASGTVMALAMVRDLFTGAAARTRLSYVAVVLSVAPIVAPMLGSAALALAGWRAIYAALGGAGLVLLLAAAFALPETHRPSCTPLNPLHGFARMLGHRSAFASAVVNALSFGALFAYISASPMVLMGALGVSAPVYGLLFAITSFGIMAGAGLNGRLSRRGVPASRALVMALSVGLVATLGLLAVLGRGIPSLGVLMPLLVLHSFCRGVAAPNATHGALEPMGEIAGLASSVVGFLQMLLGALASGAVALLFPPLGPVAMPAVMTACAAAALLAWRVGRTPLPAAAPAEMGGE